MYGYKTVLFVKLCTKRSRFKVNFTSYNVGKNSNASSDLVMIQNLNSYKKNNSDNLYLNATAPLQVCNKL